MEHSKIILITFGTKDLKNNIMKKEDIVKFVLTVGVVIFGLTILAFGFSMILTPFLK